MARDSRGRGLDDGGVSGSTESELPNANGIGSAENPVCGDIMRVWIRVESGLIAEATFTMRGCERSRTAGLAAMDLIVNKRVEQAGLISADDVIAMLGGPPGFRHHSALLVTDAVQSAVANYQPESGACRERE